MTGAGRRRKGSGEALGRLRALCLSLPGTTETASWGHPNFRAAGTTYATFEIVRGRPSIAVRVAEGLQEALTDDRLFFRTPYSANRGWVSVWVDGRFDWRLVRNLVRAAHRRAAGTTGRPGPPRAS